MKKKCLSTVSWCVVLAMLPALGSKQCVAQNNVFGGSLFTLTNTSTAPNGAWSWPENERAIIDMAHAGGPLLMVSSMSYAPSGSENGDVDLVYRNLTTGSQGEFELSNQLEPDDHDSAALFVLPDGRYVASYSKHDSDQLTRWRVSTNPNDPTSWGPEKTLNNGSLTTYNSTYSLPDDNGGAGRIYNFTRTGDRDPHIQTWDAVNQNWVRQGILLREGGRGRPYVQYASDGKKIHLITTERHPQFFNNSIYHAYIQDGQLFGTEGNLIDSNLFNDDGNDPRDLTQVFAANSVVNGSTMTRSWTTNLEIDNTGNPAGIFTVRANDPDPNNALNGFGDHRFFYVRHDGVQWHVNEMAKAGSSLYSGQIDYTGLASIDPHNPNVVYMSSEVDPITGVATSSGKYELYKGITGDFGATWNWSAVTANSTIDNLRPLVPEWNGEETALVWMRGNYTTFENWDTEVVGINFTTTDPKSQLWRGTAGTTWNNAGVANWNSGGGTTVAFNNGDEVAFDDTGATSTVNIVGSVAPNGVAFNNTTQNYTVTGGSITGTGRMRHLGGGTTTLANGNNTYSGETLIAKGTLALAGGARISGTPHIDVRSGGTFDVTGVSGGSYTLAGQTVTINGDVNGNLNATAGSTVHVNSSNSMNGNLVANASLVDGLGTVNGNINAQAGGTIRVGGDGFSVDFTTTAVTYVDAVIDSSDGTVNTQLANGSPAVEGTDYKDIGTTRPSDAFSENDDQWDLRSGFGTNGGNLISAGNGGSREDAPALRVTVTGLVAGQSYETFAYFWDVEATTNRWRGRANNSGATDVDGNIDGNYFSKHIPSNSDELPFTELTFDADADNPGPITTDNGGLENGGYFSNSVSVRFDDKYMLEAGLGTLVADSNGELFIYIDDGPSRNIDRTWFDGVGVRATGGGGSVVAQLNTFTITGDATLDTGATLELDIYAGNALDRLVVEGTLDAGGTLDVTLLDGAPSPGLGDEFQILDFQAATGEFDFFNLPALATGLVWNVTNLLTTGDLEVVTDVDLDNDGLITGADFLLLQQNNPSLLSEWNLQYGNQVVTGGNLVAAVAQVPEPSLAVLLLAGLCCGLTGRRRHSH